MQVIGLRQLLRAAGYEQDAATCETEPRPRRLSIEIAGVTVYIESAEAAVTDSFLGYRHPHQRAIVGEIVKMLPKTGDSVQLNDELRCGNEIVTVTRRRSESGPGILLIFSR